MSVAWGMNRDEALKALTINAAEILGVADRVGSLEPGKDANLFVSKGDPLEAKTVVTHVFIHGKNVGDRQQAGTAVPQVPRQAVARGGRAPAVGSRHGRASARLGAPDLRSSHVDAAERSARLRAQPTADPTPTLYLRSTDMRGPIRFAAIV